MYCSQAVSDDFYFQMYYDNLPIWGFIGARQSMPLTHPEIVHAQLTYRAHAEKMALLATVYQYANMGSYGLFARLSLGLCSVSSLVCQGVDCLSSSCQCSAGLASVALSLGCESYMSCNS